MVTSREYDSIGNLIRETKKELSATFSYEEGGLVKTVTTPSGAKTTKSYTTSGLLKEEVYPDGMKRSIVYDLFRRIVQETNGTLPIVLTYDDANRGAIRTNPTTGAFTVQGIRRAKMPRQRQ